MDDLISRKALLRTERLLMTDIVQNNPTAKYILEQVLYDIEHAETAFDKEKVINELREELNLSDAEKERCARKIHFNLILQKRLCEWNSKCD